MDGPSIASGGMMMLTRLPSEQARIAKRRGFVDAPADLADDAVGDVHHMRIVAEAHIGQDQLALALDIDLAGAVDHDVGDRLVGEQGLERAQAPACR